MSGLVLIVANETSPWALDVLGCARRGGYVTLTFEDTASAFAYQSTTPIRAVFLDAQNLGYKTAEALRAYRADSPEAAVIVVGKEPAGADLKLALEEGASAFLSWPATEAALQRLLRAASRRRPRGQVSELAAAGRTGGSTP
jgi:DNA-binding response OmpR family regulator